MTPSPVQPLISVCIPTYNGHPYIELLVDELLRSPRQDFEIVVSDDCSTDATWTYVEARSHADARLKCFRNADNLGMDRNFAAAVARASGRYVWLTGQDDRLFHQGLDALAGLLAQHPELDFVHLNYTRLEEARQDLPEPQPVAGGAHVFGDDLGSFLARTDGWLPTFLPLFVMRKAAWDAVDISRYFGTCFCQVGVFLEASRRLRWCHMDGNYVVGLTPVNGWQFKPLAYVRIVFGNYVMLDRAARRCDWLGPDFLRVQYRKIFNQLVYSLILIRAHGLSVEPQLLADLLAAIRPDRPVALSARALLLMPRSVGRLAMLSIRVRRVLRRLPAGLMAALSRQR